MNTDLTLAQSHDIGQTLSVAGATVLRARRSRKPARKASAKAARKRAGRR